LNRIIDASNAGYRIRSMLGFKSLASANITLAGIELVHMMRKQQGAFVGSLKQQFDAITA
jgi:putative transposase